MTLSWLDDVSARLTAAQVAGVPLAWTADDAARLAHLLLSLLDRGHAGGLGTPGQALPATLFGDIHPYTLEADWCDAARSWGLSFTRSLKLSGLPAACDGCGARS